MRFNNTRAARTTNAADIRQTKGEMNMKRLHLIVALMTAMPALAWSQSSSNYPSKAVRVMVGSGAGGSVDIVARMVSVKLGESLKQKFIVENRPGAGGTLGLREVVNAAPDAHTIAAVPATFLWAKTVQPSLPFDPVTDTDPVSQVTKAPLIMIIHPSVPANSVKELIDYARANPGKLNVGVSNGTATHLAAAYFASLAGLKVQIVPYKGTPEVLADLVAGRLDMHIGGLLSNLARIKAGKVRGLGVTTTERSQVLPDLPAIVEALPGYEVNNFHGWLTTRGSPPASVTRLAAAIHEVVNGKEVSHAITSDGSVPYGSTPQEFRDAINRSAPAFQKIARDSNMSL